MSETQQTFDYIIVGAGSAGCVLADMLTRSGEHQVCLLEAGPKDSSPLIKMPAGVVALLRSKQFNWQFWTAAQSKLKNRKMYWPRGRTLGGSSAINAMVHIRGHKTDYDDWAANGCTGWSYADVLPYFKLVEDHEGGADEYHGVGGPFKTSNRRSTNPLSHAFVQAAKQAGHAETADFNGAEQEGCGLYEVYQHNGERCSNAEAFLRPAEKRPNLTVITNAHATQICVEGKRATGVRYVRDKNRGTETLLSAKREVILSAGAVQSPQLLLLSGIGPATELAAHGIQQQHELPGVGENLQDHLDVAITTEEKTRHAASFHWTGLLSNTAELFKYLFKRSGVFTSNVAEAGAFLKTSPDEPRPDLQYHFVTIDNTKHALNLAPLFKRYAYSLMVCDLRPLSRGKIGLQSNDPLADPLIEPNYAAHDRDIDKLVIGAKKGREILEQAAFLPHKKAEITPGPEVQTDEQWREWVLETAETIYHPIGSCKMGVDDMAVVDPKLKVHGMDGLRVVDASIIPTLIGGNTNSPTTMIAARAAEFILADAAK